MTPPPGYPMSPPPGYAMPPPGMVPGAYYMPAAPPPKKTSVGVIIAIVIVVVVLISVVLAAVLYVMVAGLGPAHNAPQPPTAVLQGSGSWANSGKSRIFTFTVSTVVPAGTHVNPTQLQYIVSNAQAMVLYSGAAAQNTTSGGFTINVLFQDTLEAGSVSAGDRIQMVVTPRASNPLVGGSLQVNFNGDAFATGRM